MLHIYKLTQALAVSSLCLFVLVLLPEVCWAQAGTLDDTFGVGGKVISDFPGSINTASDIAFSVAVHADGKIVVVGSAFVSDENIDDFALVHYNPDGSLDPGFGMGGLVTTDFASDYDFAHSVAIQPDGKIVVVGTTRNPSSGTGYDFALARYNTDGSLDTGFGTDGLVTTDFASGREVAYSVAIQADGKIVVAGVAFEPSSGDDFALARYHPDGSLDTSFGGDGKVTTDFSDGVDNIAWSMAIQPDGKIVVAGNAWVNGDYDFGLVRYHPDGSLDTGFGTDGLVTTDISPSGGETISSVALQADDKIVVAGNTVGEGGSDYSDFALARYNTDGSLDTGFGTDGLVTNDFGNIEQANSVAIQADGKIVVAGWSDISLISNDFALARYNTDGSLDTGFGTDGLVTTDFENGTDRAYSVAVQADGKIVAVGNASIGGTGHGYLDFALARYNTDGDLDAGFGTGGLVTTDFAGAPAEANEETLSVAIQGDGKIVVAGWILGYSNYQHRDFALARYNPDGSLDASFGTGGLVTTDFAGRDDQASSVAIQDDGKIVVAGRTLDPIDPNSDTGYDFALARYNTDGSLDTNFDDDGKVTTDFVVDGPDPAGFVGGYDEASSVAIQADGKIVVAGMTRDPNSDTGYDFALARYNPDGSLDASFDEYYGGTAGLVTTDFAGGYDEASSVAIFGEDETIVVAGVTLNPSSGTGYDFALARYDLDGRRIFQAITPFAGGYGYDQALSVAVQVDGKIVVAGVTFDPSSGTRRDFALARYDIIGRLDDTFGNGGKVTTDFHGSHDLAYSVAIQADCKIVVAGRTDDPSSGTSYDFALARYNPDGSFDASFGTDGLVTTDFAGGYDVAHSVAIQADGKIVPVGGTIDPSNGNYNFALARYIGVRPQEEIDRLIEDIQNLVALGSLNNGQGNALQKKLQAAIQQLDRDNQGAATNQLEAFINQVNAFIAEGILTPEEGQPLLEAAQDIIASINASPRMAEAGLEASTAVQDAALPKHYALHPNYPNPFNPRTTLAFDVPKASHVKLAVYDMLGRQLRVLIDGAIQAGRHEATFEAGDLSSGLYVARLVTPQGTFTHKMLLMK